MTNLGGLIFRVEVDSDRSQFVMIPRMLTQLVPADQINIMSPEEWKKVKEEMHRSRAETGDMLISHLRKWKGKRTSFYVSAECFSLCFMFCLQHIISSYNRQSGITVQEAKIAFLKAIASWPTFGCTFFEVKVSHQDEVTAKLPDNNLRNLFCHIMIPLAFDFAANV